MFDIVFNANDNYVKYLSVLITSIVKNTDPNKKFQDFFEEGKNSKSNFALKSETSRGGGL
ncbi:hypothetical protein [Campylobacter sp. VTCC 70190]|uniref:hypothetical protein n=1 Tax=Campylobacter sp. VTCC 70190 TaxID=3392118 RepID=UPI00398E7AF9